jgi:hypothetical protein
MHSSIARWCQPVPNEHVLVAKGKKEHTVSVLGILFGTKTALLEASSVVDRQPPADH